MNMPANIHSITEAREARMKPQIEDGYTRIANELMDVFAKTPFTAREYRVVMAVVRFTYGYNRKEARMTATLLDDMTGLPATIASKALSGLISKKVISREGGSRSPISINKCHWEWKIEKAEKPVPETRSKCSDLEQNALAKLEQNDLPIKDSKDKLLPNGSNNSSQKTTKPKFRFDDIDMELAKLMAGNVDRIAGGPAKRNIKSWANEIRLMRESDNHTVEQIRYLIEWLPKDSFWSGNVLSPSKLRKQWTQLVIKAKQQHQDRKPRSTPGRHTNLPDFSGVQIREDGTCDF